MLRHGMYIHVSWFQAVTSTTWMNTGDLDIAILDIAIRVVWSIWCLEKWTAVIMMTPGSELQKDQFISVQF